LRCPATPSAGRRPCRGWALPAAQLAGSGLVEQPGHVGLRALARARCAHQCDEVAASQAQVKPVQESDPGGVADVLVLLQCMQAQHFLGGGMPRHRGSLPSGPGPAARRASDAAETMPVNVPSIVATAARVDRDVRCRAPVHVDLDQGPPPPLRHAGTPQPTEPGSE
jgi:hypothetical protein